MKNTEFKLRKLAETGKNPKAIEIRTDSRVFGIVYVDGAFDPRVGIELYPSELKSILTIAENFQLFYNNL